MSDETPESAAGGEVAVYEDAGGEVRVDVRLDRETVWLTQRQMAEVFDSTPENVLMHLRNIFSSGELEAEATTKEFLAVRTEGSRRVRRRLKHYNLDAIISVGYRVNTRRGVRFRQWATRTLHGHLVQGFTVNERRLAERGLREAREPLDLLARTLFSTSLGSGQFSGRFPGDVRRFAQECVPDRAGGQQREDQVLTRAPAGGSA